jgi:DNA primase
MDLAEHVKGSVDIVRVVGEYVRLKRAGAGPRHVGLCPFHTEKTPSFSVHSTHQFYKCFGCGAGGDVFSFVMQMEGLSFFEALKLVAERNGIALPQRSDHADAEARLRAAVYEMHEIAVGLYQSNLSAPAGAEARRYVSGRGISPETTREFALGLSDPSGQQLTRALTQRGFTPEQMEQSGLVLKRQEGGGFFDRFRGRLMFPIHNEPGKVIAFGGRAMRAEDEPKYLNSSETPIYRKRHVLYNLHRAKTAIRKNNRSILVEGYMDVIGVSAAGVQEVVASCGTALTSEQVRSLYRQSERIVVNFDPDAAGSNAAERSLNTLLDENMRVRILELDGELDPDEYIGQHGVERYRTRLENAVPYFYWLADRARRAFDMRSAEGRIDAWKFLQPSLGRIHDKLERMTIVNDLAEYMGVEGAAILEQFRRQAAGNSRSAAARPASPLDGVPKAERLLLGCLLSSAEARAEVLPQLVESQLTVNLRTGNVLQALIAAVNGAGDFRFSELEARLQESDRPLLSALVFADEASEPDTAVAQALECVRELENADPRARINNLQQQIRAAERNGNGAEALRLVAELQELKRGLRSAGRGVN